MIPVCFTCKKFKYPYDSDRNSGFCTRLNLSCDGMQHCASHDRLPPLPRKKKEHRVITYESKPIQCKHEVIQDKRKTRQHKDNEYPRTCEFKSLPEGFDITRKNRLYMKKNTGIKFIKVEDFDILLSLWGITKAQALNHAKYGGEVKGWIFVNRVLRRGVTVKTSDGTCRKYRNIEDASKGEGVSIGHINRVINDNKPDVSGRSFFREWYEEDIPYKNNNSSKSSL